MVDKRIGKRIKECREKAGLTQEQLAEKTGLTPVYISTVERGVSFPRCENLILIMNGIGVSADAIFCDVLDHSTEYAESVLSKKLERLSSAKKKEVLKMVDLMLKSFEN